MMINKYNSNALLNSFADSLAGRKRTRRDIQAGLVLQCIIWHSKDMKATPMGEKGKNLHVVAKPFSDAKARYQSFANQPLSRVCNGVR